MDFTRTDDTDKFINRVGLRPGGQGVWCASDASKDRGWISANGAPASAPADGHCKQLRRGAENLKGYSRFVTTNASGSTTFAGGCTVQSPTIACSCTASG